MTMTFICTLSQFESHAFVNKKLKAMNRCHFTYFYSDHVTRLVTGLFQQQLL